MTEKKYTLTVIVKSEHFSDVVTISGTDPKQLRPMMMLDYQNRTWERYQDGEEYVEVMAVHVMSRTLTLDKPIEDEEKHIRAIAPTRHVIKGQEEE